ncbi:hypothetical protein HK104_000293 [Borealophlyctis nickersoniae]|nr:hypothetical protein HK104_000293 [Borealophlyctis nickersoniae]
MGCIKAVEPAWRVWTCAAEGNLEEAVRKDMALTMAYDCLFGVAGRIDVLRQPTFTAFFLSLLGSAGFEMVMRAWDAIHLRRKMMKAVEDAADWKVKSGISLKVLEDGGGEVFNSVAKIESALGVAKHPSDCDLADFDLRVSEKPSKADLGPRGFSVLPKRMDVEPLDAAEEGTLDRSSLPPNVERDILSGNPVALIEKSRSIVNISPQPETQPASANIMSVSVLMKSWGAHRLAEMSADAIFRIQASLVVLLFISLAPVSRHACFGYVSLEEILKRIAVSTAVAFVFHITGLVMDERMTLVRYQAIMTWAPRLPWYAYGMIVMSTVAGGAGPMLAVDAGLFGENQCLINR